MGSFSLGQSLLGRSVWRPSEMVGGGLEESTREKGNRLDHRSRTYSYVCKPERVMSVLPLMYLQPTFGFLCRMWNSDTEALEGANLAMQKVFEPLFIRYGVDVVIGND